MSKPEWTKIGTVEVCVGTDGVTGIWTGNSCYSVTDGQIAWSGTKADFEAQHCQPPAPRHIIREYADGSCVVESTEKDEQGRALRCVKVWESRYNHCIWETCRWIGGWTSKNRAVQEAARYVETGE